MSTPRDTTDPMSRNSPRGPAIGIHTCYSISCSGCADECWEEGVPHFDTEAEAWKAVLGEEGHGWTRRHNGRVLCRGCSERADCAGRGHDMTRWQPMPRDPDVQWRFCRHCGCAIEDRLTALGGPP